MEALIIKYAVGAAFAGLFGLFAYIKQLERQRDKANTELMKQVNATNALPLEQQVAQDAQTLIGEKDAYEKALDNYRPGNGNVPKS